MRTVRAILTPLVSLCLICSCTAINDRLDELENRIAALETLCAQMNEEITAIESLVSAVQAGDYITEVLPVTEDGAVTGYEIHFAKQEPIVIRNGKDGAPGADGTDGVDGADGYTPQIGVRMDEDGVYYWTLDGEWLLDDSGNKLRVQGRDGADGTDGADGAPGVDGAPGADGASGADGKDGVTPQFKIEDGYWFISYDGGTTWEQLGQATGDPGKDGADGQDGVPGASSISIEEREDAVVFTLADGTVITIPKQSPLSIEFAEEDLVVMTANSSKDIRYTITGTSESVEIEVITSADIQAKAVPDAASPLTGVISIHTGPTIDEYTKAVILVADGTRVIMRTLAFEEATLYATLSNEVSVGAEGGEIELYYMSNMDCSVTISSSSQSWIHLPQAVTKAVAEHSITLTVDANNNDLPRVGRVMVGDPEGMHINYFINQETEYVMNISERDALIAIYNAYGGDSWSEQYRLNWCSDLPLDQWAGVGLDDEGHVDRLELHPSYGFYEMPEAIGALTYLDTLIYNRGGTSISRYISNCETLKFLCIINMIGEIPKELFYCSELRYLFIVGAIGSGGMCGPIPEEIGNLTKLEELFIGGSVEGIIPSTIGNCKNLELLELTSTNLTGPIPESIGQLSHLRGLFITNSPFSGTVPESVGYLPNLSIVNLSNNNLSGDIPESLLENEDLWQNNWGNILYGNNFNPDSYYIEGWDFDVEDLNGNRINSALEYAENEFTLIAICDAFLEDISLLKSLYEDFHDKGLDVIVSCDIDYGAVTEDELRQYVAQNEIPFSVVAASEDNPIAENISVSFSDVWGTYTGCGYGSYPYILIDHAGKVVLLEESTFRVNNVRVYLEKVLDEHYTSVDKSMDGVVEVLQHAEEGNGIDLILMGEAYSDRMIADGTYRKDMTRAMEAFFSEEPFTSFRNYFNVYMVNAVSDSEVFSDLTSTVFHVGYQLYGDDEVVMQYAGNAVSDLEEAVIIVAVNGGDEAGPSTGIRTFDKTGDYGCGLGITYVSASASDEEFRYQILSDACGWGFAKLADEGRLNSAFYPMYGTQPNYQQSMDDYGWYRNMDFTTEPAEVKWAHFLSDERYKDEGLGIYIGGGGYSDAYKPSQSSIMSGDVSAGFNAPSREAIYYRIHRLAFGESWEYDYEEFVTYDAINRQPSLSE